jgi:hypothetical protein
MSSWHNVKLIKNRDNYIIIIIVRPEVLMATKTDEISHKSRQFQLEAKRFRDLCPPKRCGLRNVEFQIRIDAASAQIVFHPTNPPIQIKGKAIPVTGRGGP